MTALRYSLFLLFCLGTLACGVDDNEVPSQSEDDLIDAYVFDNNLQVEKTASGLRYSIQIPGQGPNATSNDIVSIRIKGLLLDNRIFIDNFTGTPFNIEMSNETIITGLIEGLKLLNEGAQATLIMPSRIAFGAAGSSGQVPPNTPVVYLIEVVEIFNSASRLQDNIAEIEAYLKENNIIARKTSSNLYYVIEKEGDGNHPQSNATVTVHYRGYLTNGTQFDSSIDREEPSTFSLNAVIKGWQEGIPLFSKGATGKLFIPHTLGYGANPPEGTPIQPFSVLIFDIELINF